ncbi:hypothetical protein [Nocardioides sp. L-11A]|uniref:hypothetical protein n=1 Tax=Nocardioides sp. L-11A TaxID=3043848 RepID=UPI00249C3FDB|nr:hypothetical protein QJ852_14370 [Nocardioides sp. L-11A]
MTTVDDLIRSDRTIRASASALGFALASVETYAEPALARAVQAEQNLYDRLAEEFGMLTPGEAGQRLGSRSRAPRNLAAQARKAGRLLAIKRGSHVLYPGFQFGEDGQPLPVIAALVELARRHERSETGIVQWLCGPTTYLDGRRPVDLVRSTPDEVLALAERAWGVEW